MKRIIALSILAAAMTAACSKKSTTSGPDGSSAGGAPLKPGDAAPVGPVISKNAREDYLKAAEYYAAQEKAGWGDAACKSAAGKFEDAGKEHKDVAPIAFYMQGRSYMGCGMLGDAEKAFRASLGRDSNYVHSVSGLGEVAYAKGNLTEARSQWEKALSVDGRLPGAHINVATLDLAQLKKLQSGTPAWNTLEKSIRDHLSLALAVDNGNIQAYTVYALVYMEGADKNKNRLDLAKLLLDEGLKASKTYAPLHNAFGLYYMKRNNISGALTSFMAAVELDGKFAEARLNAGLIQVSSRRYADAKTQLGEVVKLQPKNYDAWIGLGIAQRGLNELADAESSYKKAKEIDGSRGEAAFNLGVLYKDFYGAKEATDLKKGKEYFSQARGFFADAQSKLKDAKDREEAKQNVTDCEKLVASYEEQIKIQASAPAGS